MGKNTLICVVCACCIVMSGLTVVSAQTGDDIQFMTEIYPPLNFEENGHLKGIGVDLMAAMLKKLHSTQTREDIRLLPWARAYKYVQTRENTCLFSMVRTQEREKLFKWVGPIAPSKIVLTAPAYKDITIQSFHDLKKYRIGTVIDDVGELLLVERGINKGELIAVSDPVLCARQLEKGRIDMWAYGDLVARWILKEQGFPPEEYETVYVLNESELYFAFSKDTPDEVTQQFQNALDALKDDGTYQKILDTYLK